MTVAVFERLVFGLRAHGPSLAGVVAAAAAVSVAVAVFVAAAADLDAADASVFPAGVVVVAPDVVFRAADAAVHFVSY